MQVDRMDEVNNYINKAFFSGVAKLIILKEIKAGSDYPYAILKVLKNSHNLYVRDTSKAEVYNILNSLENSGYVESQSRLSKGRVQKHYTLTRQGQRMMRVFGRIMMRNVRVMKRLMDELNE